MLIGSQMGWWGSGATATFGKLYGWGGRKYAETGQNAATYLRSPVQVGSATTWQSVSTNRHSLALTNDGKFWAAGQNGHGECGQGTSTTYIGTFTQVGTGTNWTWVSAGERFSTAIAGGALFTWGYQSYGRVGNGVASGSSVLSPVQLGTLTNWAKTAAGGRHAIATKTDGTLWGWGYNGVGNLGLGDTVSRSSPTQIGSGTNWAIPLVGRYFSGGITTTGKLFLWGNDTQGCLGQGDIAVHRSSPVQVGTASDWTAVALGQAVALGIRNNGQLFAWGSNQHGEIGQNSLATSYFMSPVLIGTGSNWASVSKPSKGCMALTATGLLFGWGANYGGVLGQGDQTDRSSPTQIGSNTWIAMTQMNGGLVANAAGADGPSFLATRS